MSDLLIQAMTAKQSGDISLAKQLLSQAIIQDPTNEGAWMMMSEVVEDVKLRRNCLERVLAINPENEAANIALSKLNTSPLGPVIRGERNKPLNPPNIEKTPPFTPPFTWDGEQAQYLALGELTFPDLDGENADQSLETPPTFDWATDSDEPDQAIQKIFDAVSNPELASQPLPDTDLSWSDKNRSDEPSGRANQDEGQTEAGWLDELVGPAPESTPLQQQPGIAEDFSVSAEPQWGLDAFASPEQPVETTAEPDSLLWDNPKAKSDRMVILGKKSIIYANPAPSDIPHIMGLFAENKMLRDLLGENAGVIKLESIQRLSANPRMANLSIDYKKDKKTITQQLVFSSRQVRNEALAVLQLRLGSGFSQTSRSISLMDKVLAPLLIFVVVVALGWGLIAGLPLLEGSPIFQSGTLQVIFSSLQQFVTNIGIVTLSAIVVLCGLLCLIWLVINLIKPSRLVIVERI